MRLRVCIVLAALAGAAGSLILAADMYRRMAAVERVANASMAGTAFSMAHALGNAGICILFLGIAMLALVENKQPAQAENDLLQSHEIEGHTIALADYAQLADVSSEVSTEVTGEIETADAIQDESIAPIAVPAAVSIAPTLPAAPTVPFNAAKNIFIIEAQPAPQDSAADEPIGTPIELTETEFQRAVVYENVLREQGEIPVATPIDSESIVMDAALGDDGGVSHQKT